MRTVGTVVRGIRTPIIKENDKLDDIVVDSLIKASESEDYGFKFKDRDVVAITEAVVGISEGNYATIDDIAVDIKNKLNNPEDLGIVFPILSRNRFSLILKGIAKSTKKLYVLLSFPSDEVGNGILDEEKFENSKFDLGSVITEEEYAKYFGDFLHPFTGINMIDFYRELIKEQGCEPVFILSNKATDILKYTNNVINCDIHTRYKTKKLLEDNKANVLGLFEILNSPVNGSGYNEKYGLLGSNKSTEERLKLFPRDGQRIVDSVQKSLKEITGKNIEVMVYGDGAFKDPVGKIWELADPVVSPFYTSGLEGTPNEIKLKFVSDNKFPDLKGDELKEAIKEEIRKKDANLKGKMITQGTTPRRLTDLIGSLCDLTSGSGDKGTPVVFIQGYFDNLSDE
ncbi:MAG: coenzyme F420-0:L-glutamate ligase [Bacilli bacterium]|nr:coenzyme F420-0:L-glutamate ligase [Bacilli bacterium]